MKSRTCFGKKSGKPLTEYQSESEAYQGASYARENGKKDMVPYQCGECGKWHLSLADRQTPSVYCHSCRKQLYRTEEDAQRRAEIRREEGEIALSVYKCPHNEGWHLTKNQGEF